MREGTDLTAGHSFGGLASLRNLAEAKKEALRRRLWFSSLSRVERGIIDLTVRYVDKVKSTRLAKVLTAIMDKLQSAMESTLDRLVKAVGLPLARKISNTAFKWGNSSARSWAEDRAFARFLVVNFGKVRGD